jgi:glycosyltransferase involved in cell wall biosynthesis
MISYSIVISTYNQVNTLKQALESLRRQIKNPKIYEIIIADDCSTDGTEEFVKKLHYPIFLKYTKSEETQGRSKNRNRGFHKAAGEWIIFIDGDMVPKPDFVDAYLESWEKYPEGVVIGSWILPEGSGESRWQKYLSSRGRLTMAHGDKVPGKYFTSGNFAIKKTLLEHLCGFDTSFEDWGGEDTDFGLRLDHNAIPIYYIPEACSYHYHDKSLNEILREYEKFGKGGFTALAEKYPDDVIFESGWLLGLPGPDYTVSKKLISILFYPLRATPVLTILGKLAEIKGGALLSDFLIDWLFYGHLAKGYRRRIR